MAQRCGKSLGRRKVDLFRNIELLSSDEAVLLLICFDGFYEDLRPVEIPRLSLACKSKDVGCRALRGDGTSVRTSSFRRIRRACEGDGDGR
jgi:hypothetical protein